MSRCALVFCRCWLLLDGECRRQTCPWFNTVVRLKCTCASEGRCAQLSTVRPVVRSEQVQRVWGTCESRQYRTVLVHGSLHADEKQWQQTGVSGVGRRWGYLQIAGTDIQSSDMHLALRQHLWKLTFGQRSGITVSMLTTCFLPWPLRIAERQAVPNTCSLPN